MNKKISIHVQFIDDPKSKYNGNKMLFKIFLSKIQQWKAINLKADKWTNFYTYSKFFLWE
jgi:hypothetical protein